MKYKVMLCIFYMFVLFYAPVALADNASPVVNLVISGSSLTQDEVIAGVEKRYAVSGFSARFTQESTLEAMDIMDTASGSIRVKRPGMMRWEYEKPDRQSIITDGRTLWVYRPEDNQVMIGKAPLFFGDGKGAGFLADMKLIKKKFGITLEENDSAEYYVLKLIPRGTKQ